MNIVVERFCDYSSCIRGFTKHTIRRYRTTIEYFIKQMHVTGLEEISKDMIRTFFISGRTERQWSTNTFATYHKSLNTFFEWCIKEGHTKENPVKDLEKPRIEKKLPVRISQHEATRLLETAYNYPYSTNFLRYRNHAIFATFIFAGLRRQELLNLKYGDVDLNNLSIFIRQGKGQKDRIIPICSQLAESLRRYTAERVKQSKTCMEFFVSTTYNGGLTVNGLKHLHDSRD